MLSNAIIERIAQEVSSSPNQVVRAIELLDGGCTIPFIARYRKDVTQALNEERLEAIDARNHYFTALEQRRAAVIQNIDKQEKLTPELRAKIDECMDKMSLEDLYLPFKRKRQTRACVARAKGLEPLAQWLWAQEGSGSVADEAKGCVDEDKGVPDVEGAIAGAKDIIAEQVAEDFHARRTLRVAMVEQGIVRSFSTKTSDGKPSKYSRFYDFSEALKKIPGHRLLAILRGVREGLLRMELQIDDAQFCETLCSQYVKEGESEFAPVLRAAIQDSYERLLRPSIENEVMGEARQKADESAIRVFRENTRNLLMAPAAGRRVVLGVDPGHRSGCKLAVVNSTSDVVSQATIHPKGSEEQKTEARAAFSAAIRDHGVEAIAIGNGTGSREAMDFVRATLEELDGETPFIALVNEAGASVYSASKLAREELPEMDVTIRGAVSIARRLQDPLSELVKIEPRSIGVGQYQHDVNQKYLREGLHQTVVSCVNRVGVDLNTASVSLLRYVSGIQYGTAQNIVMQRTERSGFKQRDELLEVPGIGPKVYEQCAGFLRIPGAENPLDATAVHPEAYDVVTRLAESVGKTVSDLVGRLESFDSVEWPAFQSETVGAATLRDIVKELGRPSRDPRREFHVPKFDSNITRVQDLEEGMTLEGMITNVTDFGVFVDVGVHQDGLVHLSEIAHRFVKDPRQVVRVGDAVKVKVIGVDKEASRISLSMKALQPAPERSGTRRAKRGAAQKGREAGGERRPVRKKTSSKGGRPDRSERKKPARSKRKPSGKQDRTVTQQQPERMNTQLADQLEALKAKLGAGS